MFTLDINIERSRNKRNLEEKCFQGKKKGQNVEGAETGIKGEVEEARSV